MLILFIIFTGSFYAPSEPASTAVALATDRDNDIMISGDTAGYVTIWNIKDYCITSLEMSVTKVMISRRR